VRCWKNGESFDISLGRGDLVALPPFLQHEVFNEGDTICHLQTMLAKPQPLRPQYNDPLYWRSSRGRLALFLRSPAKAGVHVSAVSET
jgi:hypothetical protein